MLSACLECIISGQVDDIYVVPISLTYERMLEEEIYTRELLGTPKQKETLMETLAEVRSAFDKCYGTVIVNFSKPMSMRELLYSKDFNLSQQRINLAPSYRFELESDEHKAIKVAAFSISERIANGLVVLPISMIFTVLLLSPKDQNETKISELVDDFNFLESLLSNLGVPMSLPINCVDDAEIGKIFYENFKLHNNVLEFYSTARDATSPVDMKGLTLTDYLSMSKDTLFVRRQSAVQSDDLFKQASNYIAVCSYRNQLINYLAGHSIFYLGLISTSTSTSVSVYDSFAFFVDLFDHEFLFNKFYLTRTFQVIARQFRQFNLIDERFQVSGSKKLKSFFGLLIKPFVHNYLHIYKTVLAKGLTDYRDERKFISELQTTLFNQTKTATSNSDINLEILSLNLIENALRSLDGSLGILGRRKLSEKDADDRSAFIHELDLQKLELLCNKLDAACAKLNDSLLGVNLAPRPTSRYVTKTRSTTALSLFST
jgi:glycerone phosphate O-acyltransferase